MPEIIVREYISINYRLNVTQWLWKCCWWN